MHLYVWERARLRWRGRGPGVTWFFCLHLPALFHPVFFFFFSPPMFVLPRSSLYLTCTFGNKRREQGRQVGRDQMPALLTLILFSLHLDLPKAFCICYFWSEQTFTLMSAQRVRCSAFYGQKPSLRLSKISAFSGAQPHKRFKGGNC